MVFINFIATGNTNISSTKHRCIMISDELRKRGYKTEVFVSGNSFLNFPNLVNIVKDWKEINKNKPDVIVIHRTSNLIDYLMVRKLKMHAKIIYDFDDAIFHTRFPGILSYTHLNNIIVEADCIFAGSHYLYDYSSKINNNTFLMPTAVDTDLFSPIGKKRNENKFVIGWLGEGTDYQLRYLRLMKEPLRNLSKRYDIKFRIISAFSDKIKQEFINEPYEVDFGLDKWVPIESIPEAISDFDIGVMPLTDGLLEKGKCAMKALEYMSLEKPVVASAVGENNHAIIDGYNGFLAHNTTDWVENIEKLIIDINLRRLIGKNGRKFVEDNYSKKVITERFINVIGGLQ
ncbi:MAG: glycosyltransferase family 4 protein [Methanobacterium sp.]